MIYSDYVNEINDLNLHIKLKSNKFGFYSTKTNNWVKYSFKRTVIFLSILTRQLTFST